MFLLHVFKALENILSFTHTQNSQFMRIIKLPIQVSAGGTSSFLWSYCKTTCVTGLQVGLGVMDLLRMNSAAGKAKSIKFYPPFS